MKVGIPLLVVLSRVRRRRHLRPWLFLSFWLESTPVSGAFKLSVYRLSFNHLGGASGISSLRQNATTPTVLVNIDM